MLLLAISVFELDNVMVVSETGELLFSMEGDRAVSEGPLVSSEGPPRFSAEECIGEALGDGKGRDVRWSSR